VEALNKVRVEALNGMEVVVLDKIKVMALGGVEVRVVLLLHW